MTIVEILQVRSDGMPISKAIRLCKDDDGWFYIFKEMQSGIAIPYSSMKEVEIVIGLGDLKIISQTNVCIEIGS